MLETLYVEKSKLEDNYNTTEVFNGYHLEYNLVKPRGLPEGYHYLSNLELQSFWLNLIYI